MFKILHYFLLIVNEFCEFYLKLFKTLINEL